MKDALRSLLDLNPGESGVVHQVNEAEASHFQLLEMGLLPGARVQFVRSAPLGDPVEIKVRDYHLSLRRADARAVGVRVA